MSTLTIRPTSVISGGTTVVATGAASVLLALNDASDASYVRKAALANADVRLALADPSVAADEFVSHISGFVRYKGTNGKTHYLEIAPAALIASGAFVHYFYANSSSIVTIEPGYTAYPYTDLTDLVVRYASQESYLPAGDAYIYELGAYVYTVELATATPGNHTESDSSFATVPVDIGVVVDAWQTTAALKKVMLEVQVESGGTGVGTGTVVAQESVEYTYGSTDTYSEFVELTDSLPNGTYKVYARAARYGIWDTTPHYGDWSAAATLTMTATVPAAPLLTVVADDTNSRVSVAVEPVATAGYIEGETIDVERSNDGGLTYVPVRGMTGVPGAFDYESDLGYDYEALRGTTVLYRSRITATSSGGYDNTGPWCTAEEVTVAVAGWNLKCPESPTLNMIGAPVIGEPEMSIDEDVGVFRPLGSRYPTVVAGDLTGWDGSITVNCVGPTQWEALKALIELQAELLLETPYGESFHIRFTNGARTAVNGAAGAERRAVPLPYVDLGT